MRLHLLVEAKVLVIFGFLTVGIAGRVLVLMKGDGFTTTFGASLLPGTLDFLDPFGNLPEDISLFFTSLIS